MRTDELRTALADHADALQSTTGAQDRLAGVDERVARLRRRRTAARAAALVAAVVVVVTGIVVGRPLVPDPNRPDTNPTVVEEPDDLPPTLVGYQLPIAMTVNEVPYAYFRSEVGPNGERVHRMAVQPDKQPQALAWATPRGTRGQVIVSVDGDVVSRTKAGVLETSLLLSPGRGHLVVVRLTDPSEVSRIGLAVYHWPKA